jgi:hypothetical protein
MHAGHGESGLNQVGRDARSGVFGLPFFVFRFDDGVVLNTRKISFFNFQIGYPCRLQSFL